MTSIRLTNPVKKELDELMLKEILKEVKNPKIIIKAIRQRHGYTHSEFIRKLIKSYGKTVAVRKRDIE